MSLKNLKNLNSPKYKASIASVVIIGGGLLYFGMKNFGPGSSDSTSSRSDDSTVRLDVSALRAGSQLEETHIDDYELDSSSEMARVHNQRREDERIRALQGDDSFVFTIAGNRNEEAEVVIEDPSPISAEQENDKESEVTGEDMEAPDVVSFQEQLRNTQTKSRESERPKVDPMPIQRQHYQASVNQQSLQQNLSQDILSRAEFKYRGNHNLRDTYSGSAITSREPEIIQRGEQEEVVVVDNGRESNSYARYMGLQETNEVSTKLRVNAGDIFYTRLQIGINTDELSPVRAEVISGPLAGAVLLGSPRRTGEKAIIELSRMSFEGNSYSIDAVALDLDTQRTSMADKVDRHYARNMAYLTITSILSGYASSLQSWEETNTTGVNSETTRRNNRLDSFDDRVVVGLGEAASELKDIFRDQVNREPTVHVMPQDIAIMFMSELVIGED